MLRGFAKLRSSYNAMPRLAQIHRCGVRLASTARSSSAPTGAQNYPCISVSASSKLENTSLRQANMGFSVHPRDLLALDIDSSGTIKSQRQSDKAPMVMGNTRRTYVCLPRKRFYLVSFGNIKAIVLKGAAPRMLLFEPTKAAVEDFSITLAASIPEFTFCASSGGAGGENDFDQPSFELGVLEEVLKEACSIFDRRIRLLKPLVQNLLEDQEDGFEDLAVKLQKLGPLEDAIQVYEMEVKEARQCILRLLQNDEDMHALCSTEDPALLDLAKLSESQMATIASVELLLESYIHKINKNYDTLQYLRQKLNQWKSMTSMSMQLRRNKLMNYNLHMAIAAVSIGSCSACAGIFGMNLTSGLEEHPFAFYQAAGMMVTFATAFQLSMNRSLFGSQVNLKLRQQASRIQGMKTVLVERSDQLDDAIKVVFDVLDNTGRYKDAVQPALNDDGTESTQISKDSFRKLFADGPSSKGSSSSSSSAAGSRSQQDRDFSRNVGQLFELLDVDKNDYLDREELAPQRQREEK